jgi:signal peptide peptidase SppA
MILHPYLASTILNEPWAINPDAITGYAPIIGNILNNNISFERGEPVLPSVVSAIGNQDGESSIEPAKQVQVIRISGALTKNSQFCGPAGMDQFGAWIKQADNDQSIDSILIVIDSPGGTVAGTETLANIIKATKKPIVAFVDDMACSAAYWLASSCDKIIANNTTAQIGSIGVLLTFMDVQPALEKMGVKFHSIVAPQSVNKTKTFDKLRAGDYEEYKTNTLAPLAQKFIDTVKTNRPNAEDKHFTADVFFAQDVVGSLIDSIGNIESAITTAASLSIVTTTAHSNPPNITMKKTELNRLAKASGVESLETEDGTINLSAEMAQAVETSLAENDTAMASLQQQITDQTTAQARISQLEAELQTANASIAELSKGAGADSANITEDETDDSADVSGFGFWSRFHNLKSK